MKTSFTRTLCALALAGLTAGTAAADSNFGIKAGMLAVDGTDSDATQVGMVYTADILGMFGWEADAHISATKGEVVPGLEYGITQFGAYGVFMTPGPVYLKAKAGYAYTDVDFPGADASSDLAYGLGAGFELFGVVMEVEYTMFDVDGSDAEMVSVGIKF
jgi:hypothetical protein